MESWEVLEEKDISPSKWFPLFVHKVKLPNGTIGDYYISKLGDIAMVIAITKKKEVVFVKQYKHGIGKITVELPAGRTDGQDPKAAAIRELKEETGIMVDDLIPVGNLAPVPSKDTAICYGFLASDVEFNAEQELDLTEDIEVVLVPVSELNDRIKSGEINGSDTVGILSLASLKFTDLF